MTKQDVIDIGNSKAYKTDRASAQVPTKICDYCKERGAAFTFLTGETICPACLKSLPGDLQDLRKEIFHLRSDYARLLETHRESVRENNRLRDEVVRLKGTPLWSLDDPALMMLNVFEREGWYQNTIDQLRADLARAKEKMDTGLMHNCNSCGAIAHVSLAYDGSGKSISTVTAYVAEQVSAAEAKGRESMREEAAKEADKLSVAGHCMRGGIVAECIAEKIRAISIKEGE